MKPTKLAICFFMISTVAVAQTATTTIDIDGKNDPPAAVDDSYTTDQDTVLTANVQDNDYDPDTNDITIVAEVNGVAVVPGQVITLPSGALLTIQADGQFTYDPNGQFDALGEGETGQDSFTYRIINPPNQPQARRRPRTPFLLYTDQKRIDLLHDLIALAKANQ